MCDVMSGRKLLVLAWVTDIHGTCVTYPSCRRCCSKLLIEPTSQSYYCIKCGVGCHGDRVLWRYRLVVSVADDVAVGKVVVFGRTLDPFFGKSAPDFHRSLVDLERTGYPAESLLIDALTKTFIGKYFYFGFKHCDSTESNKQPCLSDILTTSSVDNSMGGSQFNKDSEFENVHNLAYQMLASNNSVFSSVTDHMRHSVSVLRQSSAATDIDPVDAQTIQLMRQSLHRMPYSNLSGISNLSASICSLYRTVSFNQDSVHFTFEDNDSTVSSENESSRFDSITGSHHKVLGSNGGRTSSNARKRAHKANFSLKNNQSHSDTFSLPVTHLEFSGAESDVSNTSKIIDRELLRRQKQKRVVRETLQLTSCNSQHFLDATHITHRSHAASPQHRSLKQNITTSQNNQMFTENQFQGLVRPTTKTTDEINDDQEGNVSKCATTCNVNDTTTMQLPGKEDADFSEDYDIKFFSDSQLNKVLMEGNLNIQSNAGICENILPVPNNLKRLIHSGPEAESQGLEEFLDNISVTHVSKVNSDTLDKSQIVDISKQFMTRDTTCTCSKLQNSTDEHTLHIENNSCHNFQISNPIDIDVQVHCSDGLATSYRLRHSHKLNLDETCNARNTNEHHGNGPKGPDKHANMIGLSINALCDGRHGGNVSNNVPTNTEHTCINLDPQIVNTACNNDHVADNTGVDIQPHLPDSEGLETFLGSQNSQDLNFIYDENSKEHHGNEHTVQINSSIICRCEIDSSKSHHADVDLQLHLPDSEGLETFFGSQHLQNINFDENCNDTTSQEQHDNNSKLLDEHACMTDSQVSALSHQTAGTEHVPTKVEHMSSTSDSGICDLGNECTEVCVNILESAEVDKSLNDDKQFELDSLLLNRIHVSMKTNDAISSVEHFTKVSNYNIDRVNDCVEHMPSMSNISGKLINSGPTAESQDLAEFLDNISVARVSEIHSCTDGYQAIHLTVGGKEQIDTDVVNENTSDLQSNRPVLKLNADELRTSNEYSANVKTNTPSFECMNKTDRIDNIVISNSETVVLQCNINSTPLLKCGADGRTEGMDPLHRENVAHVAVTETSNSKIVTRPKMETLESQELEEFLANISNTEIDKRSTLMAQTVVKEVSGNDAEIKLKTSNINLKTLANVNSYSQNYSDIFADSFSETSSEDICDLNIAANSSDDIFYDSLVGDDSIVNESYDLFTQGSNNESNQKGNIGVFKAESGWHKDSMVNTVNDGCVLLHINESPTHGRDNCLGNRSSEFSPVIGDSFILDSQETEMSSKLAKLSMCWSRHTVNKGCKDAICDKNVKFDQRLRRVSTCKLMDIKMRNSESPFTKSARIVQKKSCLRQKTVYDKTEATHTRQNVMNCKEVEEEGVQRNSTSHSSELNKSNINNHGNSPDQHSAEEGEVSAINRSCSQDLFTSGLDLQVDNLLQPNNPDRLNSTGDSAASDIYLHEFKTRDRTSFGNISDDGRPAKLPVSVEMTPDLWGSESTDAFSEARTSSKFVNTCSNLRNKPSMEKLQTPQLWSQEIDYDMSHSGTDDSKSGSKQKPTVFQSENLIVQKNRPVLKCLVLNTPGCDSNVKLQKSSSKRGPHNLSNSYRGQENRLATRQFYLDSPDLFCDSPVYSVMHNVCDTADNNMSTKTSILCKKLFFD